MSQRYVWLLAIVVVLGLVVWSGKLNKPTSQVGSSPMPSDAAYTPPGSSTVPRASVKPKTPTASVGAAPVAYGDALKQYAGRVMQFNANCQVSPNQIVVKNGSSVMFDNRSGDSRWISLNGVGYQISGYGFRILPMTSKNLPETVVVDCGSAQNVGKVIVQQ